MSIELRPPDYLIPRGERRTAIWARPELLRGEENVLANPLVDLANRRILDDFTPHHDAVIFSLCTATRPYYKSRKWKEFIRRYSDRADLVICSNGGVIPIEYSHCWPFMDYDAARDKKGTFDAQYGDVLAGRITAFLDRFKYRQVLHVFLSHTRNAKLVRDHDIPGMILPSEGVQEELEGARRAPGGYAFQIQPYSFPGILNEVDRHLGPRRV